MDQFDRFEIGEPDIVEPELTDSVGSSPQVSAPDFKVTEGMPDIPQPVWLTKAIEEYRNR